jgi:hypothetical protein
MMPHNRKFEFERGTGYERVKRQPRSSRFCERTTEAREHGGR